MLRKDYKIVKLLICATLGISVWVEAGRARASSDMWIASNNATENTCEIKYSSGADDVLVFTYRKHTGSYFFTLPRFPAYSGNVVFKGNDNVAYFNHYTDPYEFSDERILRAAINVINNEAEPYIDMQGQTILLFKNNFETAFADFQHCTTGKDSHIEIEAYTVPSPIPATDVIPEATEKSAKEESLSDIREKVKLLNKSQLPPAPHDGLVKKLNFLEKENAALRSELFKYKQDTDILQLGANRVSNKDVIIREQKETIESLESKVKDLTQELLMIDIAPVLSEEDLNGQTPENAQEDPISEDAEE